MNTVTHFSTLKTLLLFNTKTFFPP